MADDALKKLEDRITRLEAALSNQGGGAGFTPGGAVVDPPPWGGGGGWGWPHWPHPVVDPAAFAVHRPGPVVDPAAYYHRPVVDPAAYYHRPGPVVDPAAFHRPVVDPAAYYHRPGPVVDPAAFARIGPVGGDPPPPDVGRFSIAQLQASLHSIAAERARLDSMEALIKQQLDKAKQAEATQAK